MQHKTSTKDLSFDDFKRYKRDKESNSAEYKLIRSGQLRTIKSQDIQVGDIL